VAPSPSLDGVRERIDPEQPNFIAKTSANLWYSCAGPCVMRSSPALALLLWWISLMDPTSSYSRSLQTGGRTLGARREPWNPIESSIGAL